MPSSPHEALHKIFQEDTSLFVRALHHALGVSFPIPHSVNVLNIDMTEIAPVERRVDTLLMATTPDGAHAFLVESQTDPNPDKLHAWPYYIAYVHAKYKCPVTLLVICTDAKTAKWARTVIEIGLPDLPSMYVRAIVFGPDNVPVITHPDHAAHDIHMAVLSALVHRLDPNPDGILEALVTALDTIDTSAAAFLAEFTEAGLGKTVARKIWRTLMATTAHTYISQTRAEGIAEGRAEGEARAILRGLEKRGIAIPDSARERITSCADVDTLDTWLIRVGTIATIDDLFA